MQLPGVWAVDYGSVVRVERRTGKSPAISADASRSRIGHVPWPYVVSSRLADRVRGLAGSGGRGEVRYFDDGGYGSNRGQRLTLVEAFLPSGRMVVRDPKTGAVLFGV